MICVELRYRPADKPGESVLIHRSSSPAMVRRVCRDALKAAGQVIDMTEGDESDKAKIARAEAERIKKLVTDLAGVRFNGN